MIMCNRILRYHDDTANESFFFVRKIARPKNRITMLHRESAGLELVGQIPNQQPITRFIDSKPQ